MVKGYYTDIKIYYYLFLFSGLWYPVPNSNLKGRVIFVAQIIRNLVFFIGWFIVVIAVYVEGFKQSMRGTAFFWVVGLITNIQEVIYYCKRQDTHYMLNLLEMSLNSHKVSWQKKFMNNRITFIWRVLKMYYTMMCSFCIVFFFTFPIVNVVLEYFGIQPLILPLPFRGLSLGKIPKDSKDRWLEVAGLTWCWLGVSFYCCVQCAFFIFTLYTAADIELLCDKIKRLSFTYDENRYKFNTVAILSPEIVTLRNIILHHQFVLKYSRNLINYLGLAFAVQNKVGALCLCVSLLTTSTELFRDHLVAINSLVISVCLIIQLCSICYFGNYLTTQSNLIHEKLYDLPWYKLTPSTRKNLILIFMQAVHPIVISYRGLVPILLQTFMQAINAAYSYFMLLKSVTDE